MTPGLRFVRLCRWLVPADCRRDWWRQWEADLTSQAAFLASTGQGDAARINDLRTRAFGALPHALYLRSRQWRLLMIRDDVRDALRSLRRRPGLSAAIILTLGLTIGANTTTFSWMDALVLQPLPGVPDAAQVQMVRMASSTRNNLSLSYPNYRELRAAGLPALTGLAVKDMLPVTARVGDDAPERVWLEVGSGNLFEVLHVTAAHGRVLQPADEETRASVVVLADHYWRARFAARTTVIGETLTVNGLPFTIVGVAPPGYQGAMGGLAMDMFAPVTAHAAITGRNVLDSRGSGWLIGLTRVAPGATQAQATQQLAAAARRLDEQDFIPEGWTLGLAPLTEDGAARVLLPLVSILSVVVAIVLLIACANVAGLLMARALARRDEFAVRAALGASRWHLVRQLLVESLVLSAAGGVVGIVMALWTSRMLVALLPPLPYPVALHSSVNLRVVLFSAGVVVLATLVFGLVPALQGSRSALGRALRIGRGDVGGSRARLRRGLVVAQVALALVLLVAAGLFVRTLSHAYTVDTGFSRRDAVLASFDVSALRLDDAGGRAMMDAMVARVSALPAVERASLSNLVPLSVGGGADTSPTIEGYTPAPSEDVAIFYALTGADYFETMGIPLVAGRGITAADRQDAAPIVVINETMARRYWPGRSAIGGRLQAFGRQWITVVGIARDGKYGQLSEDPRPVMYLPVQQVYRSNSILHVATRGDAAAAIADVRQAIADVAPGLALFDVRTMEEHLRMAVAIPRAAAMLLGVFGGLALMLAAIGLYAVLAFSVSQRTREIGVRMALGADRRVILGQMLREGGVLVAGGLVVGLGLAAVAMPLLASQLIHVSPTDLLTYAATATVLGTVAVGAMWIPARRAARLNPVEAIRD
jgi:predicted permease